MPSTERIAFPFLLPILLSARTIASFHASRFNPFGERLWSLVKFMIRNNFVSGIYGELARDLILRFSCSHEEQNPMCRAADKLCVVPTARPVGPTVCTTRLPGGFAPVDPYQRGRCPRLDSPGKARRGGIA